MAEPRVGHGGSLTPEEWQLVKELVYEGQSIDPANRAGWLDARHHEPRVRAEVERLLASTLDTPSFLSTSVPQQLAATGGPARVGRFAIGARLGSGGMGIVYDAVDERLGRRVALKVLHPASAQDEEQRRRLLWDARAASALSHPNIVCVYEAGTVDDVDYVAMELLSGTTLANIIVRQSADRASMLGYAVQIASALEAAHAMGIVHRDLKPSNVIITEAGVAKLLDFGLAKSTDGMLPHANAPSTIEGRVAGTYAYMSPEQAEGLPIDFRSDIFSFGSLLYEMLTSKRAFTGGSAVSVLAHILNSDPERTLERHPSIDDALFEVLTSCLRTDRERRFQGMAEIRVRLQEVLDGTARVKPLRIRRWLIAACAAAAVIATAWIAVTKWRPAGAFGAPATLARLTWDGGLSTAPAVSFDGTLLAYASDRAGRGDLDIWLLRVGSGDPIRITQSTADDSNPAFSPDGRYIAFRSERDGGGVYVTPSLGGTERLFVPGCRDPKYSPDGRWIACWKGEVGGAFYAGMAQVLIVEASGGQPRVFRPDFSNAAYPMWSPDGRIVFLGRKTMPNGQSIVDYWIAPDGSAGESNLGARALFKAHELEAPDGAFWIRPEAWLEGGHRLVFTARHTDATNLWSLDFVNDALAGPARALTLGAATQAFAATPAAAGEGPFAFASLEVDLQLRQLPLSGPRAGTPEPLLANLTQVGSPSISDDGSRLVVSARQADGYRVLTIDTKTGRQETIVAIKGRRFSRALISGDGRQVVYRMGTAGYLVAAGGGTTQQICDRCGSPTDVDTTGRQVLFESLGPEERLLLWSNGRVQPLIGSPDPRARRQFAARFSPDGRWIVYEAVNPDSSGHDIVVVPNAPDRGLRPEEWITLSEAPALDREPTWSQDGRTIYFLSERDGFRCIWSRGFDPAAGRPTRAAAPVAHFHYARELLRAPTGSTGAIGLSASTSHLIFTVARSTGNIWWQTRPTTE
jgi:Tol biopolymer transport system component